MPAQPLECTLFKKGPAQSQPIRATLTQLADLCVIQLCICVCSCACVCACVCVHVCVCLPPLSLPFFSVRLCWVLPKMESLFLRPPRSTQSFFFLRWTRSQDPYQSREACPSQEEQQNNGLGNSQRSVVTCTCVYLYLCVCV